MKYHVHALAVVGIGLLLPCIGLAEEPASGLNPISKRLAMIDKRAVLSPKVFRFLSAPDFDQNIRHSVRHSAVGLSGSMKPIPSTQKSVRVVHLLQISKGGMGAYLRYNQFAQAARTLIANPNFVYVEPLRQELLRAEYDLRMSERDGMLSEADGLDGEDSSLAQEYNGLEKRRGQLESDLADYNGQVSDHNSRCNPAPDESTYAWCVDNKRRLDDWKASLESAIASYQSDAAEYNQKHNAFVRHWDAFVSKIQAWEFKVQQLIERVNKALQELQDCEYIGGTSEIINTDPIESKITCLYNCCGKPYPAFHFISGTANQEQIDFLCKRIIPRCTPGGIGAGKAACESSERTLR